MIAVGIISFSMFRFAGDPVNQIVSLDTSAAERAEIRKSLGLDDPVPVQFARYFGNAMQFKFGVSYQFRQPVSNLLMERMPATLELATCATILAMVFGILMGVYSALKRDALLAKIFQAVSLIGISLPTFLIGILLIYLFAVVLGWLPSFGRGEVVRIGRWTTGLLTISGLKALILPSITLGLFQMTLIMRLVRAEMLEVLRTDYIRFARARGLTTRAIHFGHALKNTLVPVITVAGLQFGSVIAFAIITETVFQWPGMGLTVRAGGAKCRYSDHGSLPADGVPDLCHHQSGGRYPLYGCRSAPALHPQPPDLNARYCMSDAVIPHQAEPSAPPARRLPGRWLGRAIESDIFYSFRRSRLTMVAAAVTVVFFLLAIFASVLAVQNPFDPSQLELMNSRIAPLWTADGQSPYLLGTDEQGRDVFSAILYGLRISLTVGVLGVLFSGTLGIVVGLIAGYVGGAVDGLIMRIADVQLTFPAILIALLINGVVKSVFGNRLDAMSTLTVLVFAIGLSFWVQYARTVRGSVMVEKNRDYVAAAQLIGLPGASDHAASRAAERDGADPRDRDHQSRARDHHRGDAVVSGRRHARHHALARHPDPDRQQLPVFRRVVDRRLSRFRAGGADPCHQPARRLAARRAQSEASMMASAAIPEYPTA